MYSTNPQPCLKNKTLRIYWCDYIWSWRKVQVVANDVWLIWAYSPVTRDCMPICKTVFPLTVSDFVMYWHTQSIQCGSWWKLLEDSGKIWIELGRKVPEITRSFYSMKGTFRKILRRVGFIIIVTRKEFKTSINRRATPPSLDRFQLRISLPFEPEPWTPESSNPRTLT